MCIKKILYQKKFTEWGNEKKKIHNKKNEEFYVNTREIWYVKMGVNIGFESDGKGEFIRPVLVLKKIGNLFLTLALTSKGKDGHFLYQKLKEVSFLEGYDAKKDSSYAILSQVKVMDKKRFEDRMGYVSKNEFAEIQKKLKKIMF